METRQVKVIRTKTLVTTVVMEIPVTLTNSDLENAINDECNVFDLIDESFLAMRDDDDHTDVADYIPDDNRVSKFIPFEGELEEALKDDQLI